MTNRPLRIGMGACFFHADPQRAIFKGKTLLYKEESMAQWVMSRGDIVYTIPSFTEKVTAEMLMADLDALVLQGGSDVSPKTYGEEPIDPRWQGDFIRDQYEIALLKAAIKLDRPVIGLCRGLQLINAGLGGTLYQDINTQLKDKLVHRDWNVYDQNFHSLTIKEGSRLQQIYNGKTTGVINSVHHQAIKDLAPGFVVEGVSTEDDIIEAIWFEGTDNTKEQQPYIIAVQWHPEFTNLDDPTQLSSMPLLDDFLHAAQQKRERRLNQKGTP